jgi:hypothetical protein
MGWLKAHLLSASERPTRRARPAVPAHVPGLYRLETLESRLLLSADPLQAAGVLVPDKILPAAQVLILEEPDKPASPVIDWKAPDSQSSFDDRAEVPLSASDGGAPASPGLAVDDEPTLTGIPESDSRGSSPGPESQPDAQVVTTAATWTIPTVEPSVGSQPGWPRTSGGAADPAVLESASPRGPPAVLSASPSPTQNQLIDEGAAPSAPGQDDTDGEGVLSDSHLAPPCRGEALPLVRLRPPSRFNPLPQHPRHAEL